MRWRSARRGPRRGCALLLLDQGRAGRRRPPTGNIAFVDRCHRRRPGPVTSDRGHYSTTRRQLDDSEERALSFITERLQRRVQSRTAHRAPARPAGEGSAHSTVVEAGVQSLTESRATLLVMVNQFGHRGDNHSRFRAAGSAQRTAEKVGRQWKVSGLTESDPSAVMTLPVVLQKRPFRH